MNNSDSGWDEETLRKEYEQSFKTLCPGFNILEDSPDPPYITYYYLDDLPLLVNIYSTMKMK